MRMYDIIKKKRDGCALSKDEINFWIKGVTDDTVADYQTSALLMAIYYRGMSDDELSALTLAMAHSGDMADLSDVGGVTVDKHSTGGVGDKTTLIVAPIIAALGGKSAKMSGRGLGYTGGTVDKLESIKGFSSAMSSESFLKQVREIGICLAGQSGSLAPADKKLYALRDVTATVDSLPLIAASIMSKKLALGAENIVLDVKTGTGAFMKTLDDSRRLAKTMVNIGVSAGRKMTALITNMDTPLGYAVGNSLEVKECVEILNGSANRLSEDLKELCITLASYMAVPVLNKAAADCRAEVIRVLEDKSAFEKFRQTISAQGGDLSLIDNPEKLVNAKITVPITAGKSGYITRIDSEKVGISACVLGAGREKKDDIIDYGAGIVLTSKIGDYVRAGDVTAYLYTNRPSAVNTARELLLAATTIESLPAAPTKLIYDIIV